MHRTTAILFFSRSAAAEASLKFGKQRTVGHRIATTLISRTQRTLGRSGLPVFRYDERLQSGSTFGERLTHSIEEVFAAGYAHVIVVGNDCPELTAAHLRSAAQVLDAGRNVIGRDARGGIYLLGVSRSDYDAAAFLAVRWQTPFLAQDLSSILRRAQEMTTLRDCNAITDLWRNWLTWKRLLSRLASLVHDHELVQTQEHLPAVVASHRRDTGRAPPVAA